MAQLDETISDGQTDHLADHEKIAKKLNYVFDVTDFGAVGDGTTDDAAAIQAAFTAQAAAQDSMTDAEGNTLGSAPPVYFPFAEYSISETVNVTSGWGTVIGDNAMLVKAAVFTGDAGLSFAQPQFRGGVRGIQFVDFHTGVYVDTNNANSAQFRVQECGFFACTEYGLHLDVSSANAVIQDCLFRDCKHELYVESGDLVEWNGGWVSRGVLTDNYDGGIVNYGDLRMTNILMVPTTQTVTEPAWIKNYKSVQCVGVRFGGEAGQSTIVNNYFEDSGGTNDSKYGIRIYGGEFYYGSNPAIRLFKIPNLIAVTSVTGGIGATGVLVDWSASVAGGDQTTMLAALGSSTPRFRIHVDGAMRERTIASNLVGYVHSATQKLVTTTESIVGRVVFDLRDVAIEVGDEYGRIEWQGTDSSGNASGVRAQIRTDATATAGGVEMVFGATANASTTLVDVMRVTSDGLQVDEDVGFYGTSPVAQQTGVAVSAAGIHAALVNLGLITA